MSCSNMVASIAEQNDQTVAVDCVDFVMKRGKADKFLVRKAPRFKVAV